MNRMQGKITIVPTTQIKGSIKSSMIYPALEDLKVKSSSETQHFKSKAYGFNNVTVEPVVELKGDTLTVSPSLNEQKIVPESPVNGFTEVNVNAVTADIDSNIVPENIAKGVEILGVKGDFKGKPETNVFMQETEPEKKDGIWLQGNYEVENIIADTNVFAGEEWNTTKMSGLKAIPYEFYKASAVSIGTYVYLFGSNNSSYYKTAYKYDTLTDTYTRLKDIPYSFFSGSAVALGTDIYLFGGGTTTVTASNKVTYKYDTLTDTYTKLADISYEFYYGDAVAIGTDIYLFGAYATNVNYKGKIGYKYDTLTDTYSRITNIPYNFLYGRCASVGTDIYLFGGSGGNTNTYKYNSLTDKYTQLTNIPFNFNNGSVVVVDTNVYLFGADYSGMYNMTYKYDTLTDTYTQLDDIPYAFRNGSTGFNGINIYLLGGSSNPTKVQVMSMVSKEYPNKSILISQDTDLHSTNIANVGILNLKTFYDRVYYRDNNGQLLNSIPTYNGDGTTWTQIQ